MTCGKIPYESRGEAEKIMKVIKRSHNDRRLKRVYFCQTCNAWHHTSQHSKLRTKFGRRK